MNDWNHVWIDVSDNLADASQLFGSLATAGHPFTLIA